jgi:antitoxin component YwqK of YwqJK toxin-antitoxin module
MSSYTKTRSDGCTVTGTLVDNKVDGTVTVTYPSGQQESVKYFSMNVPTGTHTLWNEAGVVLSTIEYEDGKIIAIDGKPVPPEPPAPE